MKACTRALVSSAIVVALITVVSCATVGAPSPDADVQALKAIWVSYAAAAEKGDATAWLALWDEGGIQLPPNAPAWGKSQFALQIPAMFKSRIAATDMKMAIDPQEVVVAGPWAYCRGVYTQDFTNKSTGQKSRVDGKFLTIFKRQQDGSWRIYRDCFNSNLPATP